MPVVPGSFRAPSENSHAAFSSIVSQAALDLGASGISALPSSPQQGPVGIDEMTCAAASCSLRLGAKMGVLLRKLRGLIGVGLTWGILWAAITALIGLVIGVVDPDSIDPGETPLIAGGIVGLQGFVAGVAFGILLSLAETRKTILDLSLIRVAIWGLLASAALPFLTDMPIGMMWFVGSLGAASASASVAIARRAELHEPERLADGSPG